jgi:hypothetical protein
VLTEFPEVATGGGESDSDDDVDVDDEEEEEEEECNIKQAINSLIFLSIKAPALPPPSHRMHALERSLLSSDSAAEAAALRLAAVELRERAVCAREKAAAARERALSVRAFESGVSVFNEGDPAKFAAAYSLIQFAADGGNVDAKVRLGEMLCVPSSRLEQV